MRRIVTLLLCFFAFVAQSQTKAVYEGSVITEKGAWCWFADPRAIHYENKNKTINSTYIGYIDTGGNIKATQYNFLTGKTDEALIRSNFQPDDHDNPTFLVLPDERIMVFYSRHTDEACFYYRISQKAGDITALGEEKKLVTTHNTTYPSPFMLANDPHHIYLCWRGINWHPTIARLTMPDENDNVSFDWGPKQIVQSTAARPYVKYFSNGKDKIYMAYTLGHPDNENPNGVFFNYINIPGTDARQITLTDINGALLSVINDEIHDFNGRNEYRAAHPDAVVNHDDCRNWIWQVSKDTSGLPVIAMVQINDDKTSHDYYHVRWTGNQWQKTLLANGGGHFHQTPDFEMCYSGGMAIDDANTDVVYCSVPVAGTSGKVYEIVKYTVNTGSGNVTSAAVTRNSTKNNVRPYIIPNADNTPMRLLWMHGDYYDWSVNAKRPDGFPTAIYTDFVTSFSGLSQEFPKAVIPGDYPDPTVLRDGDDFYMTHSSTYYQPGFLIWHSKDLMNWEPVCRALTQWAGSVWAPDLVKYRDKYYIYYPVAGSNFVIWADKINGKWSNPIDLKVKGIDPGHIVGEDGKRYLFLSDGYMVELTDDGLATVGQPEKVYDGWEYPQNWQTECMCLESPKLIRHGDFFYLTTAEGGTAGPATSHMVVSARSKSIKGKWENSPYNPIVHTYSDNEKWWSKGHGTLIDDADGNWWIVYHAYANGFHTLGRHTLIEPVEWTDDGWFRPVQNYSGKGESPLKQQKTEDFLSDNFSNEKLGLQWTFWKEYAPESISIKQNSLLLKAKGTTPADARLLLATATDKAYETQVEITAEKENSAGLILFYSEKAFAGVIVNDKNFTVYKDADNKFDVPNPFGKHVFFKIINRENHCTFMASGNNQAWQTLAENIDVSTLHHNNYNGFYALRIGLLSAGKGAATFRYFRYKNAVPQEKDMGAYLFSYFVGQNDGLHLAYSFDGLTWTALNEGRSLLTPTLGKDKLMRDPSILQAPDGTFHMVWTTGWTDRIIGYASSDDLIHWSEQQAIPVMMHEPTAHNCWAPELLYDDTSNTYYIFWATTIPGRHKEVATSESEKGLNHRIYYVTTKDFRTFSDTKMFFNPDFSVIDAAIVKDTKRNEWIMVVKNENSNPPEKNLRITRTKNLSSAFPVNVSVPITGNYWAEGPSPLFIGDTLYVYFDKYQNHTYGAVRSNDHGETWEDVSDRVSFPEGIRHGTAFVVDVSVVENLIKQFKKSPQK